MEDKFSFLNPTEYTPSLSTFNRPAKAETSSKKPLGPPAETKKVLSEELARLKSSISGSQTLDTYMTLDEQYLELRDLADSNQSEDRYQQSFQDFLKRKIYDIPQGLISKYREGAEDTVISGILPEIGRVWFSHGNIVYFWDYYKSNSFTEYPASQDVVIHVSLVPKNNDLFTNKVKFMLMIACRTQIHLVGVCLEPDFKLIEAEVRVNTDEVPIECVSVLPNGRILMGGADGSISELSYSSQWFTSTKRYKRSDISSNFLSFLLPKFIKEYNAAKVNQISVDYSRNILYSLVTNARGGYRIEVYDLGVENNKNKRVTKISSRVLLQRIREYNQRMHSLHPDRLEIKFIQALSRQFTNDCHLMAITKNGIRVFFTFHELPLEECEFDPVLSYRPSSEFSIFLKFPPAAVRFTGKVDLCLSSIGNSSDKPVTYEKFVFTESGCLIMEEKVEHSSRMLCVGRSLTRIGLLQTEGHSVAEPEETVSCFDEVLNSEIHSLRSVKSYHKMATTCARLCNYLPRSEFRNKVPVKYLGCSPGKLSFECLSNLANFLYKPPGDLLVLTSIQLIEYIEVRPIDVLYQSLINDTEMHKIGEFIQRFGVLHTCSMLLALIVGPAYVNSIEDTIITPVPEREKTKALELFKQIGNHKLVDHNLYSLRLEDPLMCLAEFKALYLYAARILRPVWEESLSHCEGEVFNQIEQFQANQLQEIKSHLSKFKDFISKTYQEHLKKSGSAVFNLFEFVKRNEDCLELLSMITEDYSFRRVVSTLAPDDQITLKTMTYRNLISTFRGHTLAKSLIESFILQLRSNRSTRVRRPSLAESLKLLTSKCSSFFTLVDSEIYIAQECLQKALAVENPSQKSDLLEEAMKRLLRNAASVGLAKITQDLKQLRCYRGIIYLCVQKVLDLTDIKGQDGKEEIDECYEFLSRILSELKDMILGVSSGGYWFEGVPINAVFEIKDEIVSELCKHHDKNVHRIMFTWLIECQLSKEILQIESPFVKNFIEEKIKTGEIGESDLLARYCYKMMDFINSYKEFDRLAALKKADLSIEKRLEYLDMCTLCIEKYLETFQGLKEEKKVFEEERESHLSKKALARIQNNTKQTMKLIPALGPKVSALDQELLSVNELFENFSKKFNLYLIQFELLDYIHTFTQMDKKEVENTMRSTYIPLISELSEQPWPAVISEKLLELGTKYPYSFHTEYIIKKVELINIDKNIERSWLVELIANLPISVTYAQVWSFYYAHWKNSFVDQNLLYYFTVRCETLTRLWFNDLKKRLVDSAMWNKNSKEKAPPHEFLEKASELVAFFEQVKGIDNVIPAEKCRRVCSAIAAQESAFQTLRAEFIPGENTSGVLRRKINFDVTDSGSEKSSFMQRRKFK